MNQLIELLDYGFTSGHIVDLIIALMVLEGLFLVVRYFKTNRGVTPADLLPNLCAGLFLMLALRCALTGAGWLWIAACLTLALPAHLTDLVRRWR